jgi:hypothetical protein
MQGTGRHSLPYVRPRTHADPHIRNSTGRCARPSGSDLFKIATTLAPLTASIRIPYLPIPLEQEHMRTHLLPDPLHPPLPAVFDHGSHHITFVGDNMMAAERDTILTIINALVLSAYFLYGIPGDNIPPLAEDKYEPFTHYHQEHLGLNIKTRTMMVLWPFYKRLSFRKYLEENWLTPIDRRKSAKCTSRVLGVLRSICDISPIDAFLAMHLQWLLHDAFKALPTKDAFAKGFNASQVKYRWSTTPLDATGDARRDLAFLCTTLTEDPSHPAWCYPSSLLVPRTHTSEGCSNACYEDLGG